MLYYSQGLLFCLKSISDVLELIVRESDGYEPSCAVLCLGGNCRYIFWHIHFESGCSDNGAECKKIPLKEFFFLLMLQHEAVVQGLCV